MNNRIAIDYQRLYELSEKVNRNVASKTERSELIQQMYDLGKIDSRLYQDYQAGYNEEIIIGTAVTIAAIVLLYYMIEETSPSPMPVESPKSKIRGRKWRYARRSRHGARNFTGL